MSDARVRIRLFEFEGPADAANLLLAAEGLTVKPAEQPSMLEPLKMATGTMLSEPVWLSGKPRSGKKPPARKR